MPSPSVLKIHGQQIAGPGHIGADLGHQGIGGCEALLIAQAGHEVQAQLIAVEVQVRIQQEALDAQAVIPEGGLAADELAQAGGADHMPADFHRRQLVHVKAVLLAQGTQHIGLAAATAPSYISAALWCPWDVLVWVCRSASIMFPPADTLCRSAAGLKGGTFASDISLQTTSLCRDAGIIIICHGA